MIYRLDESTNRYEAPLIVEAKGSLATAVFTELEINWELVFE